MNTFPIWHITHKASATAIPHAHQAFGWQIMNTDAFGLNKNGNRLVYGATVKNHYGHSSNDIDNIGYNIKYEAIIFRGDWLVFCV